MICKSRGMLKGLSKTGRLLLLLVFAVEGGFADMPMLNWMGREKAAKATKDVIMKILREDKSLSLRLCASALRTGLVSKDSWTSFSERSHDS